MLVYVYIAIPKSVLYAIKIIINKFSFKSSRLILVYSIDNNKHGTVETNKHRPTYRRRTINSTFDGLK